MKKIKIFLQKPFIQKYVAPVLRGALQTFPVGGIAVQLGRNITHEFGTTNTGKPPHNYISIAIQFLGIAAIVWAFYTRAITVEQLLEMFGKID